MTFVSELANFSEYCAGTSDGVTQILEVQSLELSNWLMLKVLPRFRDSSSGIPWLGQEHLVP